jgi:hypothetical protein
MAEKAITVAIIRRLRIDRAALAALIDTLPDQRVVSSDSDPPPQVAGLCVVAWRQVWEWVVIGQAKKG